MLVSHGFGPSCRRSPRCVDVLSLCRAGHRDLAVGHRLCGGLRIPSWRQRIVLVFESLCRRERSDRLRRADRGDRVLEELDQDRDGLQYLAKVPAIVAGLHAVVILLTANGHDAKGVGDGDKLGHHGIPADLFRHAPLVSSMQGRIMAMPWSLPGAKTQGPFLPPGVLTLQTTMVTSNVEINSGSFGNEL